MQRNIFFDNTLIELVISILTLIIIAAFSTPFLHKALERAESKKVSSSILTLLRNQENSIFSNQIVICHSQNGIECNLQPSNDGLLIFVDSIPNHIHDSEEKIVQYLKLDIKYGSLVWDNINTKQNNSAFALKTNSSIRYCANNSQNSRAIIMDQPRYPHIEKVFC